MKLKTWTGKTLETHGRRGFWMYRAWLRGWIRYGIFRVFQAKHKM